MLTATFLRRYRQNGLWGGWSAQLDCAGGSTSAKAASLMWLVDAVVRSSDLTAQPAMQLRLLSMHPPRPAASLLLSASCSCIQLRRERQCPQPQQAIALLLRLPVHQLRTTECIVNSKRVDDTNQFTAYSEISSFMFWRSLVYFSSNNTDYKNQ